MHIPNHRSAELNGFFLNFLTYQLYFVRELRMVQFCLLLHYCTNVIKQIKQPQPRLQTEMDFTPSYYPAVSKLSKLFSFTTGDI